MCARLSGTLDRLAAPRLRALWLLVTVVLFLFAIQLLGTATDAAASALESLFARYVVGDAPALGLGWLAAYVLANGSVVAALALSLSVAEVVTSAQLFLLIAGSRIGGAGVVVLIGLLEFVHKRRYSLQRAVSMGLLTFLVTLSVYLPATAVGYAAFPVVHGTLGGAAARWSVPVRLPPVFGPATAAITDLVGPVPTLLVAVALLLGCLRLFDRLLGSFETETVRERIRDRFAHTGRAFVAGLVVTGLTTSVAFSLGVVVPLYNRRYVTREELVPYVLGANIGTLLDTLLVAVVLDSAVGVAVVLQLLGVASLITLGALVVHERYSEWVFAVDDRLREDRRAFVAFGLLLVVVPLGLVGWSLLGASSP